MKKRPNILYMMSDDHAANAISCYDSILAEVFKTPNMDRLYEEGARLDNFYSTNPICTPARACIMTGQYGHVTGVKTLEDPWDPSQEMNLARLLQGGGYQTAMFGKWHLHCEPQGFDEFKYLGGSHGGGQGVYIDPSFLEKDKGEVIYEGYVSDVITDITLDYLDKLEEDKPFFIMCNHKAPHDFWEYPERHEHLFDGIDIPVPDSLFEDKAHRCAGSRDYGSSVTPRSKVRSLYEDFQDKDYCTGPLIITEDMTFEERGVAAYQKYLKDYLRTVAGIDDSVGAILDKLEAMGELDNTIIIYTADQGMFLGEHDYQDKRWSYEESVKTPFLIRYPQAIKPKQKIQQLMANVDLAPTLLDIAGLDVPQAMQGVSQKSVWFGDTDKAARDVVYLRYWMHRAHRHDNPAHYGLKDERYKLIFYYGLPLDATGAAHGVDTPSGWELYDLQEDPYELKNLYEDSAYAEVVTKMKAKLFAEKEKLGDTDDKYPELAALSQK